MKNLGAYSLMKAQEKDEKDEIKFRFAVALYKALKDSSLTSFRKLAKEAGMEPAHIQKIAAGKLDVTLTTNIAINKALGIKYSQLAEYYDNVTPADEDLILQISSKVKKLYGVDLRTNPNRKK